MSSSRRAHLEEDIPELQGVLKQLSSSRNKQHVAQYLSQLEKELAGIVAAEEAARASAAAAAAAAAPGEAPAGAGEEVKGDDDVKEAPSGDATPKGVLAAASGGAAVDYVSITKFGWDQGEYNSTAVNIYLRGPELEGVGQAKDRVTCDFTKSSFDLKIVDHKGKNYRLLKDNLDKDIIPEESKVRVKANNIKIILRKAPGQYGPEHWTDLVAKGGKREAAKSKDPMGGIMDMMKDMYDSGDDNLKRTIGEAMMKSRSGERMDAPDMPPMPGMGEGDLGF